MSMNRNILVAGAITFITICGIFNCLPMAQASSSPVQTTSTRVVGGRWQLVHASLGLEHLPATVATPLPTTNPQTSRRVDFRKRKRAVYPPLRFTRDAQHKPRVSLKELVVSLRRTALEEVKVDSIRAETKKGRSRLRKIPVRKEHIAISR